MNRHEQEREMGNSREPEQGSTESRNQKRTEMIEEIVIREWEQFQHVKNEGGREACQDNWNTFHIMRTSQFETWPDSLLYCYCRDLREAVLSGRNLVMEKYARMMEYTAPEQYENLKHLLPELPFGFQKRIDQILTVYREWMLEHREHYPRLSARGRVLFTEEDSEWETSAETYLRGELMTYSGETLERYLEFVLDCQRQKKNLVEMTDEFMVKHYGYFSASDAEERMP
ncbi:MAG: DUF4125 family protein [Clostridiales bacterium]|nr:DUF4125 family protein [Clostridiales bacterium]